MHAATTVGLARDLQCAACERQGKILVGFYMIATQVPSVYGVRMPEDVQRFLASISIAVTLGLDLGLVFDGASNSLCQPA